MKLAVTLALVTLPFCCNPAPADCLSFLSVIKTLFMGMLCKYEATIELFSPDADMRDAAMAMKRLVGTPPQQAKDSIMRPMDKILKSPLCAWGWEAEDHQLLKPLPIPAGCLPSVLISPAGLPPIKYKHLCAPVSFFIDQLE
ncbi:PREDICTED: uteroglobin [Hipposideros armiger]|uniref:Uteroglobin n=1 Tax=Hipposideros armiger TaxID=186990 RepID=A0A8B7RI22_HIPAR|nr:PREDICTED: uteroglobin [Hipposideros armiger]